MIDHIGLDVSDIARSRAFYEAALAPLGMIVLKVVTNDAGGQAVMFGPEGGRPEFVIAEDKSPGIGNHVAFRATCRTDVDAFHAAALVAGGIDNGAPALRAHYAPDYYAAFVLDPDGFNIEVMLHEGDSQDGGD